MGGLSHEYSIIHHLVDKDTMRLARTKRMMRFSTQMAPPLVFILRVWRQDFLAEERKWYRNENSFGSVLRGGCLNKRWKASCEKSRCKK